MILKTAIAKGPEGPSRYLNSLRGFALFQCECGEQFFLRDTNTFDGWDSIKCPWCKRRAIMPPNVGERYVMKRIKSDAARAGREFDLSLEQIKTLIHSPCHYCGGRNRNTINVKSKVKGQYLIKGFKYNGLDRKHNDVGYVIDNVVPCCVICNRAKNSMDYEAFLQWIEDMIQYRREQYK